MFHIAATEENIFQRLPKDILKIILNLIANLPEKNWQSLMAFFLVNKYHYSFFQDQNTLKNINLRIQCKETHPCNLADIQRVLMANYLQKSKKFPEIRKLIDQYGCKSSNPDLLSEENQQLLSSEKSRIETMIQDKKRLEYNPVPLISTTSVFGCLTLAYLFYTYTRDNPSNTLTAGIYIGLAVLTYWINKEAISMHQNHLHDLTQHDVLECKHIDKTLRESQTQFFKNHKYNNIDIYLDNISSGSDFKKLITANQSMPIKRLAKEANGSSTLTGIIFGLGAIAVGIGAAFLAIDKKTNRRP